MRREPSALARLMIGNETAADGSNGVLSLKG